MSPFLTLFWLALLLLAGASVRWGGPSEKLVALMYVAAAVLTAATRSAFELRYQEVELAVFATDVLLFGGLAMVAVRSGRWWVICAAALQCLAMLSHLGKLLNPTLWRLGYQLMATWSAWPAIALLGVGIWTHAKTITRRT